MKPDDAVKLPHRNSRVRELNNCQLFSEHRLREARKMVDLFVSITLGFPSCNVSFRCAPVRLQLSYDESWLRLSTGR